MERWFREITDKAIRRGVFHSVNEFITAIENYLKANNDNPKPFTWTATAEQISPRSPADESPSNKWKINNETLHQGPGLGG